MLKKLVFRDMMQCLWVRGSIVSEERSALVCEVKKPKVTVT
jgi:hypothetical protein